MAQQDKVNSQEVLDTDGSVISDTPKRVRVKLATLNDIADHIARVYRKIETGELPSEEANKRIWALKQLSSARAEAVELEDVPRMLQLLRERDGQDVPQIEH